MQYLISRRELRREIMKKEKIGNESVKKSV